MQEIPAVLFVCLGNICRSPLAEAAYLRASRAAGLEARVDSAGTGAWHIGNPPDPRAQRIARANGCDISHLRARRIEESDFFDFANIFALDHDNLRFLEGMAPTGATARMSLLLDCVPGREGEAVRDPYYGDADGFAQTWADVMAAAEALVGARLAAEGAGGFAPR